ncbi:MAG: VPLPA-CTERM sorting domain-containing protein [Sneathiellales bacterium]|nr:VPLPA-CTERM sorting domain-containing protein [Sneathiellales bacterium]
MKSLLKKVLFSAAILGTLGTSAIAQAATVIIGTNNNVLNFVDTDTVSTTGSVAVTGIRGALTDVAYDQNGNLYGISFSGLYSININTGAATHVGNFGSTSGMNALTFDSAGNAYGASNSNSNLYSVNVATGAATSLGAIGGGFSRSAGDLAFANGTLYGTDNGPSDGFFSIDTAPVSGTFIGSTGLSNAYGLAFADNTMFGFSGSDTGLYSIDITTGLAMSLGMIDGFTGGRGVYGASAFVVTAIPLPAAFPMFGAALAGLALMRRLKKQN